jgi:hypothetical protein
MAQQVGVARRRGAAVAGGVGGVAPLVGAGEEVALELVGEPFGDVARPAIEDEPDGTDGADVAPDRVGAQVGRPLEVVDGLVPGGLLQVGDERRAVVAGDDLRRLVEGVRGRVLLLGVELRRHLDAGRRLDVLPVTVGWANWTRK